jgi:signal transduction histidine kinase
VAADQYLHVRNARLLNAGAYVVMVVMGFVGLLTLPDARSRWLAAPLLVVFGVLLYWPNWAQAVARHAHLYLGAQAAVAVGLAILPADSASFQYLLLLSAGQAATILPPRLAFRWSIVFFLIVSVDSWLSWGQNGLVNILYFAGGYALIGGLGFTIRQAELARRRSQALLEELQAAQAQLQEMAVLEERTRLAREMHDSLGHRLTVAVVQLEGAQRLIGGDPERAARMIATMREELKGALGDLRRTVAALREDQPPLGAALTHLAHTFQSSTGLPVHVSLPPEMPRLPEAHRLALYRVAQESLTNAQRHAAASQVWLAVSLNGGQITLTASDDGQGLNRATPGRAGGFGLRGLRERAAQLGGEIVLHTGPEGGTQLRFSLPLPD